MPRITIVSTLLLLFGLATAGSAQAVDVEKTFKFYCAQCHGADGKGKGPNVTKDFATTPRNFTDPKEMNKLTDADVKTAIKDGGPAVSKSELMPPWGKTLTDEEMDALVGYIRKLCQCKGKQG
jgi:cytochrome c oxidase cbb3-type subunit 3